MPGALITQHRGRASDLHFPNERQRYHRESVQVLIGSAIIQLDLDETQRA